MRRNLGFMVQGLWSMLQAQRLVSMSMVSDMYMDQVYGLESRSSLESTFMVQGIGFWKEVPLKSCVQVLVSRSRNIGFMVYGPCLVISVQIYGVLPIYDRDIYELGPRSSLSGSTSSVQGTRFSKGMPLQSCVQSLSSRSSKVGFRVYGILPTPMDYAYVVYKYGLRYASRVQGIGFLKERFHFKFMRRVQCLCLGIFGLCYRVYDLWSSPRDQCLDLDFLSRLCCRYMDKGLDLVEVYGLRLGFRV